MVLPLGDRFESKEKLKHFDKAALGQSLWGWPWAEPPAGRAWALRMQAEDPRTQASLGLPLKGGKVLARSSLPSTHQGLCKGREEVGKAQGPGGGVPRSCPGGQG